MLWRQEPISQQGREVSVEGNGAVIVAKDLVGQAEPQAKQRSNSSEVTGPGHAVRQQKDERASAPTLSKSP